MKTNKEAVRELVLFAVNDAYTYYNSIQPTLKNLRIKIERNAYDESKAPEAWEHVARVAALRYVRQYCDNSTKYHQVLPADVRRAAALELMEYFDDELHSA